MNVLLPQVNQSSEKLEQSVYEHLLNCVRTELPEQVLQRFQLLFVVGGAYSEPGIRATLHDLVRSGSAKQSFLPFFNRCCFILINRWQMNLHHRDAIVQLVEMLNQCRGPSVMSGQQTPAGRLRFLVQEFVRSEHFQRLRQLADFLNPKNDQDERRPLSSLLHRYPYLYAHCLANQNDGDDYQKIIVGAQQNAQKKFEQDLSGYLTQSLLTPKSTIPPAALNLKNPTLLSHQDVCSTLKHYVTKVDTRGTYQDLAQQFWSPAYRPQSYENFKRSLYEYVANGVPEKFGRCRFNEQFQGYLLNLYPENNGSAVNDFLIVRTCNQILNFMVIDSRQRPNHTVFMDLLNNVGSTLTIGLLLKVVLLCQKVKPYLERRFSLLFQHYEAHTRGSVQWLVKCFEKLNLAWSAHFGTQNLSYVHML